MTIHLGGLGLRIQSLGFWVLAPEALALRCGARGIVEVTKASVSGRASH